MTVASVSFRRLENIVAVLPGVVCITAASASALVPHGAARYGDDVLPGV